jgi:hypothetical protein
MHMNLQQNLFVYTIFTWSFCKVNYVTERGNVREIREKQGGGRRDAFYVSGAGSGDSQLCVDGFTLRYKRARNSIAGDVTPGYDSG